ncbi:hypothetical protein KCA24_36345, partial [Escherichia coli]|nr:hypothetical protein [Escherichia coli]
MLRSPDLAPRIAADMAACGVVGESTNLTAAYLAAVSRKLDRPLGGWTQPPSRRGNPSLRVGGATLLPPGKPSRKRPHPGGVRLSPGKPT